METLIRTDGNHESWDFWTFDPMFVRKLRKMGYEPKKDHQGGWSCQIPINRIAIRRLEGRKSTGRPFQPKSPAISREISNQNQSAMVG